QPVGELGELTQSGPVDGPWADAWRPLLGYGESGAVRPPEPGPVPTGDVGTVDADGWLKVLDRKKLVIIRGGANIYPLEVERVLATHPGVVRVAVCAVPDDRLSGAAGRRFGGERRPSARRRRARRTVPA
nr:hypothetical protein [Micromonospora sp. DSM 115978]